MPLQTELQYSALMSDKPHNYIKNIYSFINMYISAIWNIKKRGSDRKYLFCLSFIRIFNTVARDVPGGKRILIIKINAQHNALSKAIKTRFKIEIIYCDVSS